MKYVAWIIIVKSGRVNCEDEIERPTMLGPNDDKKYDYAFDQDILEFL